MLTDITNLKTKTQTTIQTQKEFTGYLNKTLQTFKIQVKALKRENQLLKSRHHQEITQYKHEISNLKKKIAHFSQKEIIKVLMNADDQQQTKKLLQELQTKNNQNVNQIKKLKSQNQLLKIKIQEIEQMNRVLKGEIQKIQYQKQKHLQLSVMQKIQLEEINQVLENNVKSKSNIIANLKTQIDRITQKQIDLTQQERRLKKKAQEISVYQTELKDINRFNQHKAEAKIAKISKENQFLKIHIKKLQKNSFTQCKCASEVQNFKNKYISKSRQLSKTKMELSKELFKESMNAKLRQNIENSHYLSRDEDQLLFKLTQNSDTEQKQKQSKFLRNSKSLSKFVKN